MARHLWPARRQARSACGVMRASRPGPPPQVLLLVMLGPRSYTAEDVVEIHTHGGGVNAQRVLQVRSHCSSPTLSQAARAASRRTRDCGRGACKLHSRCLAQVETWARPLVETLSGWACTPHAACSAAWRQGRGWRVRASSRCGPF